MWSHFLSLLKVICFTTAPPPRANYDVCNLLATKLIMIRISQCAACFDRWFPSGRPLRNYLIINYILFLLKLFATSWSFCCQISTTDSSHEHLSLKTSNEQLCVICPIRQSRSTSVVNLMYLTDCFCGVNCDTFAHHFNNNTLWAHAHLTRTCYLINWHLARLCASVFYS